MNVHESEKLAGILRGCGYDFVSDIKKADLILFNTCCIRESAEQKIVGNIGRLKNLKEKNKNLLTIITGCMTEQKEVADNLKKKFSFLDIILGSDISGLRDAVLKARQKNLASGERRATNSVEKNGDSEMPIYRTSGINAYVNIIYGCDNFCSYCIVPFVRGRERSRKAGDIIMEVGGLVKDGYKEITLLGQNVNSYEDPENETNFADLLKRLALIEGKFRLRFMTNHPKDFDDGLIETIANDKKICKYIHLPVQSGSDAVLAAMNRKYTADYYYDLVEKIRSKIPECGISTDLIVGFPNESEMDFEDTLELIKKVRFNSAFTYMYSRRRQTKAYDIEGQLPVAAKRERIKKLIEVQSEITKQIGRRYLGKVYEVLIDGKNKNFYTGRTDCGKVVNVKSETDITGRFCEVLINDCKSSVLYGILKN
jgi:tRNA-2-methylthio-N6-dimethylallyladenosine synthase